LPFAAPDPSVARAWPRSRPDRRISPCLRARRPPLRAHENIPAAQSGVPTPTPEVSSCPTFRRGLHRRCAPRLAGAVRSVMRVRRPIRSNTGVLDWNASLGAPGGTADIRAVACKLVGRTC
jgi:hypothetical protein